MRMIRSVFSLLIILALLVLDTSPLLSNNQMVRDEERKIVPAVFGRLEEREGNKEEDSHYIQILRNLQGIIDGWLKSINDRIEKEDVTGLEIRFLEILRSVLEWVKGKIDAKIGSSKGPKEKTAGVLLHETAPQGGLRFGRA